MKKLIASAIFFCCIYACKNNATKNKSTNDNTMQKSVTEDYIALKRFRVIDEHGFNQPIEVSSFLLPQDWQVTSGIQWNGSVKCIPEMVQASLQANSPDGNYELIMLPVTQFDWSDDPIYLDAMRRGFNMHSCTIATPTDAEGYIKQFIAPFTKGQVASTNTIDELQQQMDASAVQMTNTARSAGNYAYTHKGSAAEGILKFENGKEGIAICTVMQTITTTPGAQGGMANSYQCYVGLRMLLKYKSGDAAMARNILNTCLSSVRINPQWATAVQRFFAVVTKGAQDATWKQIQISHAAQEEISNNIIRSWEARNSSTSSSSATDDNGSGFGQYIRGVDSWTDENGGTVELSSGYTNAWSKGDGSYVLSNNPAFDPNVELQGTQTWSRMKQ